MILKDIKWKDLKLKDKVWSKIKEEPGVYRIRHADHEIGRANGTDDEGILHIGMSKNLRRRVREFYKAATTKKGSHSAGLKYSNYGFGKKFPISSLTCEYVYTSKARDHEKELHAKYIKTYLDHPPLDGQI